MMRLQRSPPSVTDEYGLVFDVFVVVVDVELDAPLVKGKFFLFLFLDGWMQAFPMREVPPKMLAWSLGPA